MTHEYRPTQRELQDRFDTRRLADRLAVGSGDRISPEHRRFVEARDMVFVATVDDTGQPTCSYKGGDPGFVRVVDETTIALPVYDGNGMFLTTGNLLAHPSIGLLFVDFETGTRLRVHGTTSLDPEDPLLASFAGAIMVMRIRVGSVFANCRRYVHHYEKVDRSPFVPDGHHEPPVPDWKRDPWFEGTLPADDPALDPDHPSAPSIPQY